MDERIADNPVVPPPVFLSPPTVPGALGTTPPAWPVVLGVFSMVIGSWGILQNACGSVLILLGGMGGGFRFWGGTRGMNAFSGAGGWTILLGVFGLLSLALSVWLLIAGIKLVKRKEAGARLHKGWAWTRIVLALLESGVSAAVYDWTDSATVYSTSVTSGGGATVTSTTVSSPAADPTMVVLMVLWMLIALTIALAYPVVVLSVLSRPWAKQEIERWSGPHTCATCGYDMRGLPLRASCPECGKDRRKCRACGYDLHGLPTGAVCPECRTL